MKYLFLVFPFLAMANEIDFLHYMIECKQDQVEVWLEDLRDDLPNDPFTIYQIYYLEGQRKAFQECLEEIERIKESI